MSPEGHTGAHRAVIHLEADHDGAGLTPTQPYPPTTAGLDEVLEALHQARAVTDEVSFVLGEPTRSARLLAAARAARDQGFSRVGLHIRRWPPGKALPAPQLADAGVTDLHVSLHGARGAVHDHHTRGPGGHARLLQGVERARTADLTVVCATVLTRSTYRCLSELPPMLASRGVSAWALLLNGAGQGTASSPRLALALPHALRALELARVRHRLPAWIIGAPLCLLGPYTACSLPGPTRARGARCEGCGVRAGCPGVDRRYLERFGEAELRARAEAPARCGQDAALARCFIEGGAPAPRAGSAAHPRETP